MTAPTDAQVHAGAARLVALGHQQGSALLEVSETNRLAEAVNGASTTANRLAAGDCVLHDHAWWRVAATGERARKATPFPCGDPNIWPVLLERHGVETLQWWQPTRWVVVSR